MVVDFSYPYDMSAWGILSRKPDPLPKHMAVFGPFSLQVWIMVVITCAAIVITYWGIGRLDQRRGISFSQAFLKTLKCMFLQGNYMYNFNKI